jgi:uncharacterized protein YdhG (YjbR/CyaY superfamily)
MHSDVKDVVAYLQEIPENRREALLRLRTLCRELLPDRDELIEYGMPCYKRGDSLEVAFASQKQYIALYVMKKEALDRHRSALGASSIGKGCIRFRKAEQMRFDVIEDLLRDVAASEEAVC